MNNFFAKPTDEWGDNAVRLTTTGFITVIAVIAVLILVALFIKARQQKEHRGSFTTKQLVFSAMAMALATVTSMIKLLNMPMGGSVTLFSMLFIVLIGYWYGPYVGIMTGMAYGLLQFVLEPIFYTIPQMLTDYPLAFGALGLAGFMAQKRNGLQKGYIVGVLGRYFFAFLSGWIFFGSYAAEWKMAAPVYSLVYNGAYLLAEGVITFVVISLPPVKSALLYVKTIATGEK